jgi:hypothetical protein
VPPVSEIRWMGAPSWLKRMTPPLLQAPLNNAWADQTLGQGAGASESGHNRAELLWVFHTEAANPQYRETRLKKLTWVVIVGIGQAGWPASPNRNSGRKSRSI